MALSAHVIFFEDCRALPDDDNMYMEYLSTKKLTINLKTFAITSL